MSDLRTEEERQEFLQEYLDNQVANDDDELFQPEGPKDGEQVDEEIPSMPENLATPVSIAQVKKSDKEGEKKKKKKKKKKSKGSNLPEAGSELADNYVEAQPEDAVEDPFDPERPLSHRVEYAIWKYRRNHKFSDEKRAIFDNYLKFGGINTGPNAFLGRATSADAPDDPEAAIDFEAAKMAIDSVPDELEEGVEVNFTEVAQVYFGNTFIRQSRFISLQDFIDGPKLIDAFLRYLQIRNVAPEYAEDLANARAILDQAKIQLPMCKQATMSLPGEYNKACAAYFAETDEDTSWMTESTLKVQKQFMSFVADTLGMDTEASKEIVKRHIKNPEKVKLLETQDWVFVKVAEIAPFDKDNDDNELVRIVLDNNEDTQETYTVYLEKEIAQHFMVGFVMRVDIGKLSNGEWFLKNATRIMPTFFMEDDCMNEEDYDY